MNWILTGVSPALLGTLAAALGASTVLLYVLKVRRRRVQVPYSQLWARVLEENRPARLWDRLKWLVSLLLQLLVLALLLLALGDPRTENALQEGRSVVLVVDTSASMTALDETGHRRRIERAREEAQEALDNLGPRDEVMLVTMDGQLEPLTPFVRDFGLVEEAIEELEASATQADVRDALRFAVDSLASRPRGVVVLVSDGAFDAAHLANFDVTLPQSVELVHRPVGVEAGNIGITAFNVRRYPANRTNYEVYVRVESYVDVPVTAELSIYGEGRLVQVEELDVPPEGAELRIYPEVPAAGRRLEARVEITAGDAVDVFALDDRAYTLLPTEQRLRVLLVTPGNLYLEGPFLLNESLDVDTITPAEYTAPNMGDPSAGYDLTVFDRIAPPIADTGNFLYFSPTGEFSPWEIRGDIEDPIIHSTQRGHAVLRWITGLRDVNIARARSLQLGEDDRAIATAIGGTPMIVVRETMRRRLMAVAFDIADTDFALRVAYPVLLLNALDWFTRDSASLIEAFRTGNTWFVPIGDRTVERVTITTPSGRVFDANAQDGRAVFYGEEVGFYTLEFGEQTVEIAGNLANAAESRIAPVADLALGDIETTATLEDASLDLRFDPWMLLIGVAFVLIVFEWATWNRRVTV